MADTPLIAIIGSVEPARAEELELRNVPNASIAGEALGAALANKGCRIVVYSSQEYFLEVDVVRGFANAKTAKPKSILVRYSTRQPTPHVFAEQQNGFDALFDPDPDAHEAWEVAFYGSLAKVDGAILLGGGQSTFNAGLVMIGKPIVACACFGGSAGKVWEVLASTPSLIMTPEDMKLMTHEPFSRELADQLIDSLISQIDRLEKAKEQALRNQETEDARINQIMLWSALFFFCGIITLLALLAVPASIFGSASTVAFGYGFALLLATAALTGAAGAALKIELDSRRGNKKTPMRYLTRIVVPGLIAGVISMALSLAPSVMNNLWNQDSVTMINTFRSLAVYVFILGSIAGLTLDQVFGKLLSMDVANTSSIQDKNDKH